MELLTNLVTNQQAEFLKVPLRMRPANCRSPGIGCGAGKRISGSRRFEARGQAGRSGDARRWLVRAAPGGLADAIDTGSKGDISDAYRCDTPNVFRK